jgi:choline dehydrogenase-like flavoprotein
LLLSGIGPADELRAVGVTPVDNMPGVGKDLQDHINIRSPSTPKRRSASAAGLMKASRLA